MRNIVCKMATELNVPCDDAMKVFNEKDGDTLAKLTAVIFTGM